LSLQRELERLEALGRNPNVSREQRQKARDAWTTINDDLILAAWDRIEERTAIYETLVSRLAAVVDDISANRLTTAVDDITSILNEVTDAASEGGESSGDG
jgi:hypothetical protein